MSVAPEDVQRFVDLGWELADGDAAVADEPASDEADKAADARRKPRKVAEQS